MYVDFNKRKIYLSHQYSLKIVDFKLLHSSKYPPLPAKVIFSAAITDISDVNNSGISGLVHH